MNTLYYFNCLKQFVQPKKLQIWKKNPHCNFQLSHGNGIPENYNIEHLYERLMWSVTDFRPTQSTKTYRIITVISACHFWSQVTLQYYQFFSSPKCPDWLWGPASCSGNKYQGSRWQRREVYSSPSIVEVKNEWSYTSNHPICLYDVGRDFTF